MPDSHHQNGPNSSSYPATDILIDTQQLKTTHIKEGNWSDDHWSSPQCFDNISHVHVYNARAFKIFSCFFLFLDRFDRLEVWHRIDLRFECCVNIIHFIARKTELLPSKGTSRRRCLGCRLTLSRPAKRNAGRRSPFARVCFRVLYEMEWGFVCSPAIHDLNVKWFSC